VILTELGEECSDVVFGEVFFGNGLDDNGGYGRIFVGTDHGDGRAMAAADLIVRALVLTTTSTSTSTPAARMVWIGWWLDRTLEAKAL